MGVFDVLDLNTTGFDVLLIFAIEHHNVLCPKEQLCVIYERLKKVSITNFEYMEELAYLLTFMIIFMFAKGFS